MRNAENAKDIKYAHWFDFENINKNVDSVSDAQKAKYTRDRSYRS